jgi:hypothetical protein
MRGQSNAAKPPSSAQTGWSVWRKSSIFAGLTTVTASRSSAQLKEASQHFVYVAATPLRGGECCLSPIYSQLL